MNQDALDVFGKLLMTRVRDESIDDWERIFSGRMKDAQSQEIFSKLQSYPPELIEFIRSLLPKIVDTTLHHLLWTLEQEEAFDVSLQLDHSKNVVSIRELSDGLAGELYTQDGWISQFSNKPY